MPPIGYADKKRTRKVRFTTGVFHDGVDYGPDCEQQECEVNQADAMGYVRSNRAVYADEPEAGAQQRDPQSQHRDPDMSRHQPATGGALDTKSAKALVDAKPSKGGK